MIQSLSLGSHLIMQGKQSICYQVFDEEILPKINKDGLFEIGIGIAPISIREISPENNLAEIDFI